MTHDEMIEVITAHRDGKVIEYCSRYSEEWTIATIPVWDFSVYNYRVKPKPLELRNLFVVVDLTPPYNYYGKIISVSYSPPNSLLAENHKVIHVREVPDEVK